jgi:hypothetical protein
MSKVKTGLLVAAALFGGMVIGQAQPVQAQLGSILKGGAIVIAVDKFSGDIDRFVNTITGNRTNNAAESTRVVPILTIGGGTYAGAVQVSGPKNLVDTVKAVAQLEGRTKLPLVGDIRGRALVPISDRSVANEKSLNRVKGVGVSALIDIKL